MARAWCVALALGALLPGCLTGIARLSVAPTIDDVGAAGVEVRVEGLVGVSAGGGGVAIGADVGGEYTERDEGRDGFVGGVEVAGYYTGGGALVSLTAAIPAVREEGDVWGAGGGLGLALGAVLLSGDTIFADASFGVRVIGVPQLGHTYVAFPISVGLTVVAVDPFGIFPRVHTVFD